MYSEKIIWVILISFSLKLNLKFCGKGHLNVTRFDIARVDFHVSALILEYFLHIWTK